LARWLRLFGKKRGARRTGSRILGSVGEALFFAGLFLLGSIALVVLIASVATESWLASHWAFWLTVLVLLSFILIGSGGAIYTVLQAGTSAERRAALAKRARDIDLISDALPSSKDYPAVPRDGNLTNSPGITLAYRLPMTGSPGWTLLAAFVFSLVWNVLATVFVVVAINKHVAGQPDWLLTIVTIPSVGVGLWSIYFALRRLLVTIGVGPTSIEISDHPLLPGHRYDVFLTQLGHLSINSLDVSLVCEEAATYRQGTNVCEDTRRVFEQCVYHRERFEIQPGIPFEHQCQLEIPRDCMHSFKSENNSVSWKLVVRGKPAGWSEYRRTFPVVVYPSVNGNVNGNGDR